MYYLPTLDEFHTGFEYERLISGDGATYWEATKYTPGDNIELLKTRVKYLDDTDIVELGFSYNDVINNKVSYTIQKPSVHTIDYYELLYELKYDEPFVELVTHSGYVVFSEVNIKNKSELKWLLSRYGVV